MIFTIDSKFAEVANRFWCAVTNCKSNTKNDREVLFRLPKYRSFHKDWIHATGRQFDNLPSKIFICQTNLKKSAQISDGNFKMDCTVKSVK